MTTELVPPSRAWKDSWRAVSFVLPSLTFSHLATMRGSNLLPKQLRSLGKSDSWLNRTITSNLLAISSLACGHPIHTVVAIALLASTSYVGLLQESLFDSRLKSLQHNGKVDVKALLQGSRTLELSERTSWKWQFPDDYGIPEASLVSRQGYLPCGHGADTDGSAS